MRKHSKPTTLPIGPISSGTLRAEDLLPTFLAEADALRLTREERGIVRSIRHALGKDTYDYDGQDSADHIAVLGDILNNHTPDYCYFGAHDGDGARFGVWIVSDLFEDSRQGSYDGCVYRSVYSPTDIQNHTGERHPVPSEYSHYLQVNERGNATLYRRSGRRWVEVWSVV